MPPLERRHDSFRLDFAPGCVVPSHMLPAYARVDLAFERGDGVWLTATNGDRYLDFASGVAVNALGHSHPHLVKAIAEQYGISADVVYASVRRAGVKTGRKDVAR